jgi:hypothetical protein
MRKREALVVVGSIEKHCGFQCSFERITVCKFSSIEGLSSCCNEPFRATEPDIANRFTGIGAELAGY